jgi:hypothetical protein
MRAITVDEKLNQKKADNSNQDQADYTFETEC